MERLNKDIIQVLRAMYLEYKVSIKDWTNFVSALQANLNHTPVPLLGNHAPVGLFCVLPAMSPMVFYLDAKQRKSVHLGEYPQYIEAKLQELRESAQLTYRKVISARAKQTSTNVTRNVQRNRTSMSETLFFGQGWTRSITTSCW